MNSISLSFFGRIFSTHVSLTLTNDGVVITNAGSAAELIAWTELSTPLAFEFSILGQRVSFSTSRQQYLFSMMAYASDEAFNQRSQYFWVKHNQARLNSLLTQVEKLTTHRFLRQSWAKAIKSQVMHEHARWLPWIKESKCLAMVAQQIGQLEVLATWDDSQSKIYQERYIQAQLSKFKSFFDHVESNPLTQRQRRACVIDDDNNLLLAGAGTGKTSVMVGRAGYLLESNQAEHKDILLLAYGRKAADEMDQRIKQKLGNDKIKATTFHSLGLQIISQVEGAKPSLSLFAEDEQAKTTWVQHCFDSLIDNYPQYRTLVFDYFSQYYYVEKNNFDFDTLGDYYRYLDDNDVRSLKGDKVKSFGELYIANWLFYHGIEYVYEAPYQKKISTVERRQYKPDFYLPELDLYIEYYGIDEAGNTAAYIDRDEYHQSMAWKAATHQQFNTQCIALTYAQLKNGRLLAGLEQALIELDIEFEILPVESILASLRETGRITRLAQLFAQLLGLYKAAQLTQSDEVQVIQRSADAKQTEKALALLKPILSAYNQFLAEDIDFEDMIVKATNYVQSGRFKSPWKYIMVDEFQDISEPRARLVKALRDAYQGCSLFAVGDDWQAIYRFSGADIRLTTQFAQYFGFTSQTELDLTFRFNNKIGQVASSFISKNPAQLGKTITAKTQVATPAVSLLKRGVGDVARSKQSSIRELANGAIDDVLAAISVREKNRASVYLLARFWFQLPNKQEIKTLCAKYPRLKIASQSLHAAKGKEADYVVIIGLQTGKHGFPSAKATAPILEAILPPQESFPDAEERRLFYVALTRAKHRAYIIADMTDTSGFVKELVAEHEIEEDEFARDCGQVYAEQIKCMRCGTGELTQRNSGNGIFYSCSLYPRCKHVEQACNQCGSPMSRARYVGFKVCVNQDCKHILPTCNKCGAEMILRSSSRGEFWGCRNYRGDQAFSCKNGKDKAMIQWPAEAAQLAEPT